MLAVEAQGADGGEEEEDEEEERGVQGEGSEEGGGGGAAHARESSGGVLLGERRGAEGTRQRRGRLVWTRHLLAELVHDKEQVRPLRLAVGQKSGCCRHLWASCGAQAPLVPPARCARAQQYGCVCVPPQLTVARGGAGGRGNGSLGGGGGGPGRPPGAPSGAATAGEAGTSAELLLELKLLADVGLVVSSRAGGGEWEGWRWRVGGLEVESGRAGGGR